MLKQLSRVLPITLGIALLVSATVFSLITSAAFPDVPGHPYEQAINFVESNGIVEGYPDGSYKPDDSINRAEFTKIVVSAVHGPHQTGDNCFPDVTTEWFAPFVCSAQSLGIIGGYPDGTFKPDNEVNYAEALKIVLNTYAAPVGPDYDEWYQKYVDFAAGNGLSYGPGKNPSDTLTRGEMAELIHWIDGSPSGNPGATGCMSDADCQVDESCNTHGLCVKNMAQCLADADCPAGEVCTQGTCTLGITFFYPFCGSDSDCYTGQSCNGGQCEFNNPGAPCKVHTDCSVTTQYCLNDQCTESAIQCVVDTDCNQGLGETCNTGIFSCERPCGVDTDCPTGQVCDGGMCDVVFIPNCSTDADCTSGQLCDPTMKQCV